MKARSRYALGRAAPVHDPEAGDARVVTQRLHRGRAELADGVQAHGLRDADARCEQLPVENDWKSDRPVRDPLPADLLPVLGVLGDLDRIVVGVAELHVEGVGAAHGLGREVDAEAHRGRESDRTGRLGLFAAGVLGLGLAAGGEVAAVRVEVVLLRGAVRLGREKASEVPARGRHR
jgi:hypothetical protein